MGVSMAHDLLKIGLTLVVLALVVAAMALLVSGYLSAYKPGEKGLQKPIVTGGKSSVASVPSPTPGINATMVPLPRYAPPAPYIPVPAGPAQEMPSMPMEMQPPAGWQGPPSSQPSPSYAVPAVPAIPSAPGISGIIQILFRILPLIFHQHYDLTPIWPQPSR